MSQLAAAVEMLAEGQAGKHTAEAASRFGNQTMLGFLEKGQAQRDGINSAADILVGELPPKFSESAPAAEIADEPSFMAAVPPAFSANSPLADIGAAAGGL